MEYCSLMSGSWGNCHYIKAGTTQILIDAGQSGKSILNNLDLAGGDPRQLSAILVTHAHRDHVLGVGILARRFQLPVYATEGTWFEMMTLVGDIPQALRHTIDPQEKWQLGDFSLEAFPTSHDALESVGYVVRHGGAGLGIATDCGVFTSRMERTLFALEGLVLEANHDLEMLRKGKYPYYLKKRISGVDGHLSNEDAGNGLLKILGTTTKNVVLAHLSQENNTPDTALQAVLAVLAEKSPAEGPRPAVTVAPRCQPSGWITI